VFRSTAEGETGHAHGHLEFSKKSAIRRPASRSAHRLNLKASIAGETHEYTDMYPGMAKTAREEGFDEIADWFETWPRPKRATPAASRRRSIRSGSNRCHIQRNEVPREGRGGGGAISWFRGAPPCALVDSAESRGPPVARPGTDKDSRMSREGSLDAPTRDPIAGAIRISPTRRSSTPRCAGSSTSVMAAGAASICAIPFPRLFDLIDASPTDEVHGVKSEDFSQVVEACTLCDMCFMTKCPYVPPHPFQSRFSPSDAAPRAAEAKAGQEGFHRAAIGRDGPQRRLAVPARR
jgi:hypothetical protein